jgi:diguanylate cyclase (GGDEF)-like protein
MSMHRQSGNIIAHLRQELQAVRQRAEYWEVMAMTDDLTGLHNRRLLKDLGDGAFDRRDPSRAADITLLFIDLDDFGKLNKRYGDDVGDEALRVLASGIRKNIRKDDIAIRKGGDEFIIILIGADIQQANEVVLKRIQRMLDGDLALKVGPEHVRIRGSVGAFTYDRDLSPFDNIKLADELMRSQKQERKRAVQGEGRIAV